jgi:integral membrane protein
MENNKLLTRFRWLAVAEGISYLLLGITVPLKRIYNFPEPNFIVGSIHGVLFIAYCIILLVLMIDLKWSFKKGMILFLASLIPFGTFWAERKYLRGDSQ